MPERHIRTSPFRAQKLIDHLLSHPDSCESDGVAYELLNEYFRGSPIETLRVLLSSSDDRLVGEATWIASELPELGKPLLKDVRGLLGHQSKKVRFWAVLCVLLWADSSNGCELASAIPLVDDIEKGVRWQAMGFLSMTSREQLQAALAQLRAENANSPYICELGWLLGQKGAILYRSLPHFKTLILVGGSLVRPLLFASPRPPSSRCATPPLLMILRLRSCRRHAETYFIGLIPTPPDSNRSSKYPAKGERSVAVAPPAARADRCNGESGALPRKGTS